MNRLTLLLVLGIGLAVADEALARVGGGQSYSSGSGGRGGSSGGGGGGGGEAELVFFLIRLCIQYPAIGVPLLLLFVGFLIFRGMQGGGQGHAVHRTHHAPPARARAARLSGIRERDPGFSSPVLIDFVQLVHRRAWEALGSGRWEELGPFVAPSARSALQSANADVASVTEVVLAGTQIVRVDVQGKWTQLQVRFLGSHLEQRRGGGERRIYTEESWVFRRGAEARSLPPDDMLRMGCPSCGSAVDTDPMGACKSCGTVITTGALQWQATGFALELRRAVTAPEVGWSSGGDEPSVHEPTVADPELASSMRRFRARHPDFDPKAFRDRVSAVYHALQEAWSDQRWEEARPYVTDAMFQSLRFWMDSYARAGLRNRLEDVRLDRQEIVKVDLDAWYESITVRVWGGMKDSVVDGDGKVLGGNPKLQRNFSEYWTFLRAAGTGAASADPKKCPSCGAPLDKVNQAGVCGYCETRITSGRFDWVLTRIDQPDAYQG